MEKNIQRVTLDLPRDLYQKIKIIGAAIDQPVRELVIRGLEGIVANVEKEVPEAKGMLNRVVKNIITEESA
jgi:hypothetical protein